MLHDTIFGKFTVFNILFHRLGNAAAILGWLGQVFLVLYSYLITELLKPLELERKRTGANLCSMGLYRMFKIKKIRNFY